MYLLQLSRLSKIKPSLDVIETERMEEKLEHF